MTILRTTTTLVLLTIMYTAIEALLVVAPKLGTAMRRPFGGE